MKKIYILFAAVLFALPSAGQDLHFSLPNASPVYYNPASIGMFRGDRFRLVSNYRNQWSSIAKPYSTIAFTADAHYFGTKERTPFWGFALGVYNDAAGGGGFKNLHFDLGASYNLWINKEQIISGGLLAGAGIRSFDVGSMTWDNQFDGAGFDQAMPSGESVTSGSKFYPDVAAGIHWRYLNREETLRLTAGAAMYHLNAPDISMGTSPDKLYSRMVLHAGSDLSISSEKLVYLTPSVIYMTQGPHKQVIVGSGVKFHLKSTSQITDRKGESSLTFGVYKRTRDSWIVNARVVTKGFGIGVSYDLNTSDLNAATNGKGGPEITLSFIPTIGKLARMGNQGWLL